MRVTDARIRRKIPSSNRIAIYTHFNLTLYSTEERLACYDGSVSFWQSQRIHLRCQRSWCCAWRSYPYARSDDEPNFYSMIEIFLILHQNYILQQDGSLRRLRKMSRHFGLAIVILSRMVGFSTRLLRYWHQTGLITVSNEPWLVRTMLASSSTRVAEFRKLCASEVAGA